MVRPMVQADGIIGPARNLRLFVLEYLNFWQNVIVAHKDT